MFASAANTSDSGRAAVHALFASSRHFLRVRTSRCFCANYRCYRLKATITQQRLREMKEAALQRVETFHSLEKRKKERNVLLSTEEKAAIVIQTRFRGMKERRAFRERYVWEESVRVHRMLLVPAPASMRACLDFRCERTRLLAGRQPLIPRPLTPRRAGARGARPSANWQNEQEKTRIRGASLQHGMGSTHRRLASGSVPPRLLGQGCWLKRRAMIAVVESL